MLQQWENCHKGLNVLCCPGQPRVVGSLQPIVTVLGDDVILPCRLQPSLNVELLTVEWSRPDLKPDPSDRLGRVDYVYLYRGRREDTDMKLQSYVGRTELSKDGLKNGDISLKILNVTLEDGGRYRCFIPKLKGPRCGMIFPANEHL
uniref:Ig-like domain-containing protein n=1 Tax=Dicentrarchus labrax TaxID=13489 RepID=A0A8C4DRF6_DICLA